LFCVIDVSGSMAGTKLNLVKSSLEYLISELKSEDRIAIVIFGSKSNVVLDLIPMDDSGKEKANLTISKIHTQGSTNLSAGVFDAIDLLNNRKNPNDVSSILLFTDGEANLGITKSPELCKEIKKKIKRK